ncbi:protein phosphatase 2C 2-like [Tripterygium wilfordii]|uniref:protein-serine/threonine phosphatase n=1 Tax=Tripterygium wilfordii TaxID=458696 RepID=A0A7J7CWH2_TRIWF|nr:probable protein phosphatase 2C 2 [Tripterygium wilfordii]KAF5738447.1 protein phosphatase 2C 2-like [Tripterygium wilfordii]
MSCAVAVPNSPIFSPPAFYCKSPSPAPMIGGPDLPPPTQSPLAPKAMKNVRGYRDPSAGATLLKRKRPGRLEIPVMSASPAMNSRVKTPGLDLQEVEVEQEGYSVYCKRGKRSVMEDRYSASVDLDGDSKHAFFGVFDGHGGAKAADFAAENLCKNILAEVSSGYEEDVEMAINNGYINTDKEFLKEGAAGGACCVTALIWKDNLLVSNLGDCRAVMSRGGRAETLTSDHHPSRKDENERIQALGGYVDCFHGVWRLQGSLAVSRAIGDQHLKKWVTAEPETTVLNIKPDCEFLILASDGLWEKVTDQEAVDIVRAFFIGADKPKPFSACKKLADLSIGRGSVDDISVMIVQLSHFVS